MAQVIDMPRLSDTMTDGTIAAWHKKVGDKVKVDELLAEIETDKATMDYNSPYAGVLLHIAVDVGQSIPVSGLLAIIGKEGEDVSNILASYANKSVSAGQPASAPADAQQPVPVPTPVAVAAASAPTPQFAAPTFPENFDNDGRIKASPLAKAIAKERGITLAELSGTGEGGRIIKRDVEAFSAATTQTPNTTVTLPTPGFGESFEEVNLSQMRKTIARRLSESKYSAPHFYLTMAIDMENAKAIREKLNAESDTKISFNDLVIKAVALALRKHPQVNASWAGDKIRINHHIHIGMAVAIDEGLIVPVIRFADTLGLSQIAQQSKAFAEKAKNKQLQPQDYTGNTFTISNLGMFGISEFTAIINAPDACILAVGAIEETSVVKTKINSEGISQKSIEIGYRMNVTLSCDHRVVDGAVGAAFLQTLKQLLENPLRMLL